VTPARQAQSKAAAAEAASILAAQVDELGALEAELAPLKPRIARAEALRSALRARFEGSPADAACEARGRRFIAALGPKATERTVDVAALGKSIGLKALCTLAKVTLKAATAYGEAFGHGVKIDSAPTGARPLKLFELGKAA